MNWLINTLGTSIGKKLLMAITGLCFCGFLTTHLAGNLTIYAGKDAFNAYAEHLHSLGPLLTVFEWILLTLAIIHVLAGAILVVLHGLDKIFCILACQGWHAGLFCISVNAVATLAVF